MKWLLIFGIAAVVLAEVFTRGASRGSGATGGTSPDTSCGNGVQSQMSCCGEITSDPSTWPTGDANWDICRAIGIAEGANVAGSEPDTNNNPGDLSKGDEHGQPVTGYVTLQDAEDSIIFASKRAGWNALYAKISNARNGQSKKYSPSMTWAQFAAVYAGNAAAWLANVTATLGVSPSDPISAYGSEVASLPCNCCGTGACA